MVNLKLFVWALVAGSFIPLVGILNGRAGRVLGDPLFACILVFIVGLVLAIAVTAFLGEECLISKVLGSSKELNILLVLWLRFMF